MNWTEEQLLGLAPDSFTIRAARGLTKAGKWQALGRNQDGAWAELPNSRNKDPFKVMLLFEDMTLWCACQSTKAPCNHGLMLLLLLTNQLNAFETAVSPPTWFIAKQKRHNHQKQRTLSNQKPNNLQHLRTGMSELELWLKDLIRNGLADLPGRPKKYWTAMADRMVDAEAPIISHKLRALSPVPVKKKDWPEHYLRQLGQLYLLTQGFKHWESQTLEAQADLKTAVGWLPTEPSHLEITGDWVVLGRHAKAYGRHRRLCVWLWSITHNRAVIILQRIAPRKATSHYYATGMHLSGTIQLANGNRPIFGLLPTALIANEGDRQQDYGYGSISEAYNDYAQSKAVFPWLTAFPMLLRQVKPKHTQDGWILIDKSGTVLPLVHPFSHGWHLEAISNGRFLSLFGIWDGTALKPISVQTDQRWLDLHVLRGVR